MVRPTEQAFELVGQSPLPGQFRPPAGVVPVTPPAARAPADATPFRNDIQMIDGPVDEIRQTGAYSFVSMGVLGRTEFVFGVNGEGIVGIHTRRQPVYGQ